MYLLGSGPLAHLCLLCGGELGFREPLVSERAGAGQREEQHQSSSASCPSAQQSHQSFRGPVHTGDAARQIPEGSPTAVPLPGPLIGTCLRLRKGRQMSLDSIFFLGAFLWGHQGSLHYPTGAGTTCPWGFSKGRWAFCPLMEEAGDILGILVSCCGQELLLLAGPGLGNRTAPGRAFQLLRGGSRTSSTTFRGLSFGPREGLTHVLILKATGLAVGLLLIFLHRLGDMLLSLRLPQQLPSCLEWAGAFGEASSHPLGFEL